MKHSIHHDLDLPLARKAIDKAMEAYSARFADYDPTYEWTSDNTGRLGFRAKGLTVSGELDIQEHEIYVSLEVPFILRIFRGKAIEVVENEVQKWVDKAKAGELD